MKLLELMTIVILFSSMFVVLHISLPDVDEYVDSRSWVKVYSVSQGETLWDIAEEINTGEHDTRLIIAAIKKVNGIESMLKANQKLILPNDLPPSN